MAATSMRSERKAGPKRANQGKGADKADVQRMRDANSTRGKPPFRKAYGFGLVTAALFLLSWTGQFVMQLMTVRNESAQHRQPFEWGDFLAQFFASTFENWQSEFLQLVWQAAGLTLLLFWGSSQSRESDERIEVKLDRLLEEQGIDPADLSARVNRSV